MARKITRRGFVAASAVAAGLAGLAGCGNTATETPAESTETKGSGYTETKTDDGWMLVDNGDGKQLGYSPESGLKLIEQDGYAFKDFEGTGELVPYEDWRLSSEERAADLAQRVSLEQIYGLMCFSAHQSKVEDDCSVTDEQKTFLDGGVRAVLNAASGYPAYKQATWANNMQAYAEGSENKLPINFSSDPRPGKNAANWPGNLALAATFDPEVAREAARGQAKDLRKMGVYMFLGPQTDVASDPRWTRFSGTFGEDPALSRDTVKAFIDGMQSTVDDSGNDLGWGKDSMAAMVKHWPAEGAGEGGREGHTDGGKYAVYPGKNFEGLMIPFVDGAFKLDGKTGCASSVMTSYTIAYDEDQEYGEYLGSGFSKYKVTELLRERFGFKGSACTDWAVINDPDSGMSTAWGLESANWNPGKRISKAVSAGVDQMGGWNDPSQCAAAFEDMKANVGEEEAEKSFRQVAERLLLSYFNTGIFENPYVSVEEARNGVDKAPEDVTKAAQVKGIVMLKNHDGVIKKGSEGTKPKVYVPMRYRAAYRAKGFMGASYTPNPATCSLPLPQTTLGEYFDLVTDTLAETLTGPVDEKSGKATPALEDLTRLTAADIADVDYVLVCAAAPANASVMDSRDEEGNFIPLSLQYRPYVADGPDVRQTSIAGDPADGSSWGDHDSYEGVEVENRSYYGHQSLITNEDQLDQILDAAKLAHEAGKPCIVILDITKPMCVHEFEPEVDAILVSMSGSTEAACRIVAGLDEPSALLPMQMPKDMLAVEKQLEDVPRDLEVYTDADGNEYDFGFGLNYSGKIDDERTKKYCVEPLTKLA